MGDDSAVGRDLRIGRLRSNRIPNRIGRYDNMIRIRIESRIESAVVIYLLMPHPNWRL